MLLSRSQPAIPAFMVWSGNETKVLSAFLPVAKALFKSHHEKGSIRNHTHKYLGVAVSDRDRARTLRLLLGKIEHNTH